MYTYAYTHLHTHEHIQVGGDVLNDKCFYTWGGVTLYFLNVRKFKLIINNRHNCNCYKKVMKKVLNSLF